MLAEHHLGLRRVDEIDDPLYGSTDAAGAESVAAVSAAAEVISKCCEARNHAAHLPAHDAMLGSMTLTAVTHARFRRGLRMS